MAGLRTYFDVGQPDPTPNIPAIFPPRSDILRAMEILNRYAYAPPGALLAGMGEDRATEALNVIVIAAAGMEPDEFRDTMPLYTGLFYKGFYGCFRKAVSKKDVGQCLLAWFQRLKMHDYACDATLNTLMFTSVEVAKAMNDYFLFYRETFKEICTHCGGTPNPQAIFWCSVCNRIAYVSIYIQITNLGEG